MEIVKTSRRFTYGDQFDQEKTPLLELLHLIEEHVPSVPNLQEAIRAKYFPGHGNADNSRKMAMNCRLSLNAYNLIQTERESYSVTPLASELLGLASAKGESEVFKKFAVHILTNLYGLTLLRLIENIRARGEQVSLEYLGEELNDIGIKIAPNCTYVSTMRSWLAKANVFQGATYAINWDVVYDLLNVDSDLIDSLYALTLEQKYFLLSMLSLSVTDFIPSNKIAKHTRSVYHIRVTTKNLVKDVLEPLEVAGLIETQKTTTGRGAKPHEVRLAEKSKNELLTPLVNDLAQLTELTSSDLNRTFEDVVSELTHEEKHKRGIALELFAVWIVRLLGLRFSKWRLRSFQATGGAEVDVLAASDKLVYSRWQIQCKNIKGKVDVDVIAKEVGLTFLTKADVVAIITTGSFTSDAINYANQVTDNSRYYVILLEGNDLERIVQDRTRIIDILNVKARRTFAKKELGITDLIEDDEAFNDDDIGEEIAEQAEEIFLTAPSDEPEKSEDE